MPVGRPIRGFLNAERTAAGANRRGKFVCVIDMTRVAFIGLGRMGFGMARRLLDCGHELRVFNRTAARGDDLVRRGAVRMHTPGEACAGAEAVVSMVTDDQASRAVWHGSGGVLAAKLAPGVCSFSDFWTKC